MQLKGDIMFAQLARKDQAVFHRYAGIFDRVPEKARGCFCRYKLINGYFSNQRFTGVITQQIRATTLVGKLAAHPNDGVTENAKISP